MGTIDHMSVDSGGLPQFDEEIFLSSLFGDAADEVQAKFLGLRKKVRSRACAMFDLDDTLCSRRETLAELEGLANNRGEDGNAWLLAYFSGIISTDNHGKISSEVRGLVDQLSERDRKQAFQKFGERFYSPGKLIVNFDELLGDIEARSPFISTAGIPMLQEIKLNRLGISHIPHAIVPKGSQKIKQKLLSILEDESIPASLEMNEDRPEYWHMYAQVVANILDTPVLTRSIYIDDNNIAQETWKVMREPI